MKKSLDFLRKSIAILKSVCYNIQVYDVKFRAEPVLRWHVRRKQGRGG